MSTNLFIRPESHEIDTAARREVPRALPIAWEHRESTGRDYGIDMQVEIFREGIPMGALLLLQIKGTTQTPSETLHDLVFDAPVRLLRYAEKFPTPILLTVCPILAPTATFFYLWLQEYIRVVLDFDISDWRDHDATVRVRIPRENRMPGKDGHLAFIANYPKRQDQWARLARVQHDLQDSLQFEEQDRRKFCDLFQEALGFTSLFRDDSWQWGVFVRETVLAQGLSIARRLAEGVLYTKSDLAIAMGFESREEREYSQELIEAFLWAGLKNKVGELAALIDQANSIRHLRVLWEHDRSHDF